jgi:hypothetical protein
VPDEPRQFLEALIQSVVGRRAKLFLVGEVDILKLAAVGDRLNSLAQLGRELVALSHRRQDGDFALAEVRLLLQRGQQLGDAALVQAGRHVRAVPRQIRRRPPGLELRHERLKVGQLD